jgi:hypothetical protein
MDRSMSELADRIETLEVRVNSLQKIVNQLILIIHLSDTDLKENLHLLES